VRNCFRLLFTDRAIVYRESLGYDHFQVGLSAWVSRKMVRSDVGSSGVAFSLDTESGFKDVVLINGSYGLGEMVVQGAVSPDEFLVFKPTLAEGLQQHHREEARQQGPQDGLRRGAR
jgi:pyruvate,water dikinase